MNTLHYLVSFMELCLVISKGLPSPSQSPFPWRHPPFLSIDSPHPCPPQHTICCYCLHYLWRSIAHFPGSLGKKRGCPPAFEPSKRPQHHSSACPSILKPGSFALPHFSALAKTLQDSSAFLDDSKPWFKDPLACFSMMPFHHPTCHRLCMCFHCCFHYVVLQHVSMSVPTPRL